MTAGPNAIRIFRLLIVVEIVLSIASIAVAFLPIEALPPDVESWLSGDGQSPLVRWMEGQPRAVLLPALVLGLAFVAAYVAALVGLFFLKRWARALYVATFVAGVILYPLMGASITTPVAALVDYLLAAGTGAILAFLFVGPVQERFAHA